MTNVSSSLFDILIEPQRNRKVPRADFRDIWAIRNQRWDLVEQQRSNPEFANANTILFGKNKPTRAELRHLLSKPDRILSKREEYMGALQRVSSLIDYPINVIYPRNAVFGDLDIQYYQDGGFLSLVRLADAILSFPKFRSSSKNALFEKGKTIINSSKSKLAQLQLRYRKKEIASLHSLFHRMKRRLGANRLREAGVNENHILKAKARNLEAKTGDNSKNTLPNRYREEEHQAYWNALNRMQSEMNIEDLLMWTVISEEEDSMRLMAFDAQIQTVPKLQNALIKFLKDEIKAYKRENVALRNSLTQKGLPQNIQDMISKMAYR